MRFVTILLLLAACGETTYEFAPTGTGGDGSGDAPRAKTNSQFVRGVYADLLGRAPTSYTFSLETAGGDVLVAFPLDEQALLLNTLDAVGDPAPMRNLIVAGLVKSTEAQLPPKATIADPGAWIGEQFQRFLGREPNAYELAVFVDEWNGDPAVGPETVVRALLASREYQGF
jgi:hypothetical protein